VVRAIDVLRAYNQPNAAMHTVCFRSQQKEAAAQQQAAMLVEAAQAASDKAASIGTAFQLNNLPEHDSSGMLLQPFTATTAGLLPGVYSFDGNSSSSSSSAAVDSGVLPTLAQTAVSANTAALAETAAAAATAPAAAAALAVQLQAQPAKKELKAAVPALTVPIAAAAATDAAMADIKFKCADLSSSGTGGQLLHELQLLEQQQQQQLVHCDSIKSDATSESLSMPCGQQLSTHSSSSSSSSSSGQARGRGRYSKRQAKKELRVS
jgi:hypothetical protein